MASSKVPDVLKPITPFVQRGREIVRGGADEVIAYHCFKHAMDLGIKLNDKSADVKNFLMELMTQLEEMKPHLQNRSQDELRQVCENFAQATMQRAERIDQAGEADKGTAQTYLAAVTFFEILKQFSPERELEPDMKQLILYCKWRATEILKAIKEGRRPTPPGARDDAPGSGGGEEAHSPPPPARPAASVTPPPAMQYQEAPAPAARRPSTAPAPPSAAATASTHISRGGSLGVPLSSLPKARKADTLEYIKFARAALEADDVQLTIERLQAALKLLHQD